MCNFFEQVGNLEWKFDVEEGPICPERLKHMKSKLKVTARLSTHLTSCLFAGCNGKITQKLTYSAGFEASGVVK